MEICTDIKKDEKLLESFLDLVHLVFGLDLKTWNERGFWQDDYIPYCAVEDGRVVANVSVNVCNFKYRTRIRHLAQLGTVMTDPDFRGRGYIGQIMNRVLNDCNRSFEGTFLYAEGHMKDFYEKYGFSRTYEYRCTKKVNITTLRSVENIPMETKDDWDRMVDIILRRGQYGERVMMGNPGLFMFYLSDSMTGNVYYVPSSEAYVVASESEGELNLYAVFSSETVSLGDIITSFGNSTERVNLCFMPENNTGFELKKIEDDDNLLFTRGDFFDSTKNERFMFPEISHA